MKFVVETGFQFNLSNLKLSPGAKQLRMFWIPPGTFLMGSHVEDPGYDPLEDELFFRAAVSEGFWLGQYPVTQACWMAVMKTNPSHFQNGGVNRPVENVSWHDAMAFCEQLNRRWADGLPAGFRFSLPTEMQWEYACRAGTQTPFYGGESESDLARTAWYAGNSGNQTHPVGEKEPNAWGLHDMLGNVLEWCYDTPEPYPPGPLVDWIGQGKGIARALRGSGYGETYESGGARCASRGGAAPDAKRPWIGFRLCLRRLL